MKILLNGEPTLLPSPCTLPEALAQLGRELPPRSAVAINAQIIPRPSLHDTQLEEGDDVLLILPTFGG